METFRAALGIGASKSALPPLPNRRKNIDEREHSFLDRDPPVSVAMDVDDPKAKADKKKDSNLEHSKKATRKKSRKGYDSGSSDFDDYASGRKLNKSAKKHDRRRQSDRSKLGAASLDVDDRQDDSKTDGGRGKNRGEVQKQKFEGSESDSDADRARGRKKELIKEGRQRHDSSEGDSPVRVTLILKVGGKRREVKFKTGRLSKLGARGERGTWVVNLILMLTEQEVIEKKWLRKVVIGTTPVRTTLILMVRGKRREVKFKRKD
ncbi:hypothetical protein ES288_D06G227000v1 [Gossypium darwinii]|uniref:Uncharacterized protein n=1 Tax=Gossypium darwinii TaxID=34276 RepID=A0A5D2CB86_GOSDA|nr:hypothetical protein ES288_D06G227000v1 [Gossypium darwinii]